jgi:hypothetical protein
MTCPYCKREIEGVPIPEDATKFLLVGLCARCLNLSALRESYDDMRPLDQADVDQLNREAPGMLEALAVMKQTARASRASHLN